MIHVLAIVTTRPGLREQVLREFRANVPAVLAEEGCIEYGPAIDAEDPGPAGFSGSIVIAEFASIEAARDWADADPYVAAGVYARVEVRPSGECVLGGRRGRGRRDERRGKRRGGRRILLGHRPRVDGRSEQVGVIGLRDRGARRRPGQVGQVGRGLIVVEAEQEWFGVC